MRTTLLSPPSLLAAAALFAGCGGNSRSPAGDLTVQRFVIAQPALTESSGLARSAQETDLYWSHNDSGGPSDLYAFDGQGAARGRLQLRPAVNLDWEDMSAFVEDGMPRLLVADIGDNRAIRASLRLYVLDEPRLEAGAPTLTVAPLQTLTVRYPDGPRDAEAVAVDAVEGMIYLLSKRDAVPRLYRLPLHPQQALPVAEALGEILIPRAAEGADDPKRINWATSMDFDAARKRAAVVTLSTAYVYTRADGESWAQAFRQPPRAYALPDEPQIEAVAWSADGRELLITSEGSPTPAARMLLD